MVALFVVIGVVGAVVGSGDDDSSSSTSSSSSVAEEPTKGKSSASSKEAPAAEVPKGPKADVKITKCEVDPTTTWPAAELLITNGSSKASNYLVSIEFVDSSGKRLGEAFASTNNLAPGQASEQTAQGLDQITTKIKCKVTEVTRYAS
ncbi:FxLYD domain-containing protein [Streptomyces sp. NPDC057757]|uniref:FxLYD domain-containing protein n=1 Tax=Streptomyces sp. NPDC057757 TaxID=3346241 RepID=UPI0036AD706C